MSESDGLTSKRFMLQQIIGRFLDYPSVYMGGASPRSIRRADDLIRTMQESGFLQDDATLDARIPWPSESDAELMRKVNDRLAHADELRRQLDKSIAECVALTARAEAAEALVKFHCDRADRMHADAYCDDEHGADLYLWKDLAKAAEARASRARREALEEAKAAADALVNDPLETMAVQAGARAAATAIRALIEKEPTNV